MSTDLSPIGGFEFRPSTVKDLLDLQSADKPDGSFLTCLEGNPEDIFPIVTEAMGVPEIPNKEWINKTFAVKSWLLQKVRILDPETGDYSPSLRTVLITEKDEVIAFTSVGILQSLSLICLFFGLGPWNPPVPVQLKEIATKGGRRLFSLRGVRPEKKGETVKRK